MGRIIRYIMEKNMFETTNQYTILERLFDIFFGVAIVASPQLKEKHVGSPNWW